MEKFISCDWGTSAFRLRLVETETQTILSEIKTDQGIAATCALWKNNKTGINAFLFYLGVISTNIETLEKQCINSLENIPIVISGMATSSIGMIELPYKELPFRTDGSDLLTHIVPPTQNFKHRMIFISGIKSATDVLRGEETILAGCNTASDEVEEIFIFPGTHSKHIVVKNGIARDFKTYMTGEFFDLLCKKSILSASIENGDSGAENEGNAHFTKGVTEGAASNLLNNTFHVRTNQLFKKMNPRENYHYLSGLLIGTELKDLLKQKYSSISLVSSGMLGRKYFLALDALGLNKNLNQINADKALINGQSIIYSNRLNKEFK